MRLHIHDDFIKIEIDNRVGSPGTGESLGDNSGNISDCPGNNFFRTDIRGCKCNGDFLRITGAPRMKSGIKENFKINFFLRLIFFKFMIILCLYLVIILLYKFLSNLPQAQECTFEIL
jgi:hypothetical protein